MKKIKITSLCLFMLLLSSSTFASTSPCLNCVSSIENSAPMPSCITQAIGSEKGCSSEVIDLIQDLSHYNTQKNSKNQLSKQPTMNMKNIQNKIKKIKSNTQNQLNKIDVSKISTQGTELNIKSNEYFKTLNYLDRLEAWCFSVITK